MAHQRPRLLFLTLFHLSTKEAKIEIGHYLVFNKKSVKLITHKNNLDTAIVCYDYLPFVFKSELLINLPISKIAANSTLVTSLIIELSTLK